jgi:dinuclear metal center YbgI/SA1388 family protein
MPTLEAVLDILEEIAPSHAAENWDNPGLQIGDLSQEVCKIFISLDPTLKSLRKAVKRNAQVLLTHHPLILKPISSLNRGWYPGDVIFESIERGVSIIAAHTNLDAVRGGINDGLADLFGLQEVRGLEERSDLDEGGLGRIGDLPKPVRLGEVTERIKVILGAARIGVIGRKDRRIKRVAVVGGSGGGMVALASKKGAQLLITGEVRHHEALEAEALGLALIEAGHFQTEKPALKPFADHLRNRFLEQNMDVIVEVNDTEKSPVRYE